MGDDSREAGAARGAAGPPGVEAPDSWRRHCAMLVEHAPIGMCVVAYSVADGAGRFTITSANPAAGAALGSPTVGEELTELARTDTRTSLRDRCLDVLLTGQPWRTDHAVVAAQPGRVFLLYVFRLGHGTLGVSLEDVTDRAEQASQLRYQALHDGLTGLANRRLFGDRLRRCLDEGRRAGTRVALLMLDLNRFKQVNDTLGHDHGDRLLAAFGHRLRALVRDCDTIARLGGDEFGLLLAGPALDLATARRVAQRALGCLDEPFEIDGHVHRLGASVGIALYPDHGDDPEVLTKRADAAMYAAKRAGGGFRVHRASAPARRG